MKDCGKDRVTLYWAVQRAALGLVIFGSAASVASAQEIVDRSFVTDAGERVQVLETILDAPIDDVWALFSTSEGLRSWMAPVVEIELQNGGRWEASYDATKEIGDPGNIVNEVVAFIPGRLLVLRVESAPPDYPLDLDLVRTTRAIFEMEPVEEGRTRLTVSGVGYGDGEAWDMIYRVGLYGNQVSIQELHARIREGPKDWGIR